MVANEDLMLQYAAWRMLTLVAACHAALVHEDLTLRGVVDVDADCDMPALVIEDLTGCGVVDVEAERGVA